MYIALCAADGHSSPRSFPTRWPLIIVLGLFAVSLLGVKAWGEGREVGYSILVLAGCVLFGLECVAAAIRSSGRR